MNAESSLKRRIMDVLDGKSIINSNNNNGGSIGGRSGRGAKGRRMDARGRGGSGGGRGPRISAASLSLNDIQEMMNDDATTVKNAVEHQLFVKCSVDYSIWY